MVRGPAGRSWPTFAPSGPIPRDIPTILLNWASRILPPFEPYELSLPTVSLFLDQRRVRVLALETTEKGGGVAVLDGHNLLARQDLGVGERSAAALAPAIKHIWRQAGWEPSDTDLIAVAVGPGSFTGLRVGIATAKTLAYALKCQVLGVNTLQAIAYGVEQSVERLHVWIDAQREQSFAATFRCRPGEIPEWIEPARIVDNSVAVGEMKSGDFAMGPAFKKLGNRISSAVSLIDPLQWSASATCIGQLAMKLYEAGQRDDIWSLLPLYLRASAAEEKISRTGEPQP